MENSDPRGYYTILGIQPTATPALVKAAYRVRAMELHPDRNQDAAATAEFQQLQAAYDVLSDPKKRAAYDAPRRTTEAAPTDPSDQEGPQQRRREPERDPEPTYKPLTPVACTFCSAISAQPRVREFLRITSFFVTSTKTTVRGIFCAKCEVREAVKATGTTLLLGWWNLTGFFWTLEALIKNPAGGPRFALENATVLAHQAMYFLSNSKAELARAVALEAREATKVGKPSAEMTELRDHIDGLLASTKIRKSESRLKTPARFWGPRFGYQIGMIGAFALVIGGFIASQQIEAQRKADIRAAAEQERLVREGIERQQAAEVAAKKAEALAALAQPLPPTGILKYTVSQAYRSADRGFMAPFKVSAPVGASYAIKMVDALSGEQLLTFFVRAGESHEFQVPLGSYKVKMASGSTWYGPEVRFGPDTQYSEVSGLTSFTIDGDQLMGHEIQLSRVRNGNLRPVTISADAF